MLFITFIHAIQSACVSRSQVIAKAMEWVNDKVPYDAGGHHQGYRTDCSGFASCCWRLPKDGLSTGQFIPQGICKRVGKQQLQMGDLILAPGHHVAIFEKWVDKGMTQYWLIQERGSGYLTQRRIQDYPYKNETDFFPCKVLIACENEILTNETALN